MKLKYKFKNLKKKDDHNDAQEIIVWTNRRQANIPLNTKVLFYLWGGGAVIDKVRNSFD